MLNTITQMRLDDDWSSVGGKLLRAHNHPDGDGLGGDSACHLRPQRTGRLAWPTPAIEAGYAENIGTAEKRHEMVV